MARPVVNGVVERKLSLMDDYLRRVEALDLPAFDAFQDDFLLRKATERILQVLAEAMIDIAERWIAVSGGPPPATSGEAVARLADAGVISHGDTCQRIVKFRNFIVHHYDTIDAAVVYDILTRRLPDLRRFVSEVWQHVRAE